jgi:EAL domain-containing protein (putative c-di-GMP-specific phosphodiesterase class I)
MICQKLTHWEHDIEFGNKPVLLALGGSRLNDQQTPHRYKKIVTAAGVAPERIGLVIKESQILQDIEFAQRQICAFKQEGFKVIIDRFCCGLAYLGKFSQGMVDMIRLDGEIISRLDERIEWLCVVEGLIRIARQLNIQTIVDGIDNDFQYQTLLNVSAEYWQGDYVFILSNDGDTSVAGNKNTR